MRMRRAALLLWLCWSPSASASALSDAVASCAIGTWCEFTTNNIANTLKCPGSTCGGVLNIIPYADGLYYSPSQRRAYFLGSDDPGDGPRFVYYDEDSNTWVLVPETGQHWAGTGVAHQYDGLALSEANGELYDMHANTGAWWKMSLATGVWTALPNAGFNNFDDANSMLHHPLLNRTYFLNSGGYRVFNHANGQFSGLNPPAGCAVSLHEIGEWNPVLNVGLIAGGNLGTDRNVCKIDAAGTLTELADPPVALDVVRRETTYDPVSGVFLVFDGPTETFWTFDIQSDVWTQQSGSNAPPANFWLARDSFDKLNAIAAPIAPLGAIMFVACQSYDGLGGGQHPDGPCRTYVYRHASGGPSLDGGAANDGGPTDAGASGPTDGGPGTSDGGTNAEPSPSCGCSTTDALGCAFALCCLLFRRKSTSTCALR